eukprot:1161411-Pelagomonas_calceolata.AAC.2
MQVCAAPVSLWTPMVPCKCICMCKTFFAYFLNDGCNVYALPQRVSQHCTPAHRLREKQEKT